MVAVTVWLWQRDAGQPRARRGPGLLHQRGDPARRRDARAHRQGGEAGRGGDPRQPGQPRHRRRSPASTSSAAASATTRRRSSSRRCRGTSARSPRRSSSASSSARPMGIKEALVLAFNPPAIFGLGTAGGFEFYMQNRGEGGAKRLTEVTQAVPRAREPGPEAGRRADAVARDRAAALRRRRPREGEEARRADRRGVQRAAGDARHATTSTTSTSTAAPGRC